jgi:hypothetical protein
MRLFWIQHPIRDAGAHIGQATGLSVKALAGAVSQMLVERRTVVIHERQRQIIREAIRLRVGDRHVQKVGVVDHLGAVFVTDGLFVEADKMPMRTKIPMRGGDLPAAGLLKEFSADRAGSTASSRDDTALRTQGRRGRGNRAEAEKRKPRTLKFREAEAQLHEVR